MPTSPENPATPTPVFHFWRLPPPRGVDIGAGGALTVFVPVGHEEESVRLEDGVRDGDPFRFLVAAGADLPRAGAAMTVIQRAMTEGPAGSPRSSADTHRREAQFHLRALQALDGVTAGASQRTVASILFGDAEVSRRWTPDGELRAQVRYLLRRAQALRAGGYRRLLTAA